MNKLNDWALPKTLDYIGRNQPHLMGGRILTTLRAIANPNQLILFLHTSLGE